MRHSYKLAMTVLLMVGPWTTNAHAHPSGRVIGAGATPSAGATDGTHVVYATVGQAVVGQSVGIHQILSHGFWAFGGSRVLAVDPRLDGLPKEFSFGAPAPNPARGNVAFALALPRAARVSLTIFDLAGREAYRSEPRDLEGGYHQVRWDGRNRAGLVSGPGVYFARIQVDGSALGRRRFVMIR